MIRGPGGLPRLRRSGSLHEEVRFARLWLPLAILGVVLLYQLGMAQISHPWVRFWAQLLFYGIVGPIVTYVTLNWIANEVKQRERAQQELAHLYDELRASHELLTAIQRVTERFATAADLEAAIGAATDGIRDVTGAAGVAVMVGPNELGLSRSRALNAAQEADALARDRDLREGKSPPEERRVGGAPWWVLTLPLLWGGGLEGSLQAYYADPPEPRQREAFSILASEFSAAAEASRGRTRDLLMLFDVDRSIRAEGNLERLLDVLLALMMTRAAADVGAVFLADDEKVLHLRSAAGDGAPSAAGSSSWSTANPAVHVGQGLVGLVAERHESHIVGQLSDRHREGCPSLLAAQQSAVALPLLSDSALLGVVVLGHATPDHFDDAALPFLGLLANQVSLAVRNANAYIRSEELAIAEERARIAREIHDGVAQTLAFAALKLDLVTRIMRRDPDTANDELAAVREALRETIKEVRRSIFALRPIDLERYGFVETVRRYATDFGQQNDVHVRLELEELPDIGLKSEAMLFRVFQEAMNNVAKHARASNVDVTVGTRDDGEVFIAVRDDGVGFDVSEVGDRVTSAGGLGLRQMSERVEARGGRFSLESAPGQGTRLLASVPP